MAKRARQSEPDSVGDRETGAHPLADAGEDADGDADPGEGEEEEAEEEEAEEEEAETIREWLTGKALPRSAHLFLGLIVPMAVAVVGMWRLRPHTVDDAYISYRYAENLANGLGLVYNEGERIEGYTNFLWTVLLAGAIKLGAHPNLAAKLMGGACALGSLALVYRIAERLRPLSVVPCLATWLLASSSVFLGYAVWGLETIMFAALVLLGVHLMLGEEEQDAPVHPVSARAVPWSGLAFAAAGLTRPEAPLYAGVFMLFLGGEPLLPISRTLGAERKRSAFLFGAIALATALGGAMLWLRSQQSGLTTAVGALAALVALLSLTLLPRRLLGARNLVRGALFALPVAAHLLWRKSYYGAWLPNTLGAKTGDARQQFQSGLDYLVKFGQHEGTVLLLMVFSLSAALVWRHRHVLSMAALSALTGLYVLVVGGDWMPLFRYLAPLLPFVALMMGFGARAVIEQRSRVMNYALLMLAFIAVAERSSQLNEDRKLIIHKEKDFWDRAAGGVSRWFAEQEQARGREAIFGTIALGDIGQIGYETRLPILDLLGLVDPVIAKLPGGYTNKIGPGFRDRFFDSKPRYFILISAENDCNHPSVTGSRALYYDPRFRTSYTLSGRVRLKDGFSWCVYEHRDHAGQAVQIEPEPARGPLRNLMRRAPGLRP